MQIIRIVAKTNVRLEVSGMATESILYKGQAAGIGEAAEQWKLDHLTAMVVRDLEQKIIPPCLSLVQGIAQVQKKAFRDLFRDPTFAVDKFDAAHRAMYSVALFALALVEALVNGAVQEGYVVERSDEFTAAHQQLKTLAIDFRKRWPRIDLLEVEAGLAEIRAGKGISAEDFFRELAHNRLAGSGETNANLGLPVSQSGTDPSATDG